jgi:hypothetical protein
MFTVTDPRGYIITLTDLCWKGHIAVQHPEMVGREDEVQQTIETPDYIYESRVKHTGHLYFREIGIGPGGTLYLMVVVDIRERAKRGFVQTAFIVEGLSKGSVLLWQRT